MCFVDKVEKEKNYEVSIVLSSDFQTWVSVSIC